MPLRQLSTMKTNNPLTDKKDIDSEILGWQKTEWTSYALLFFALGALIGKEFLYPLFHGFHHGLTIYHGLLVLTVIGSLLFAATASHELGILKSLPHKGPRSAHEHICKTCYDRWRCKRPYYCEQEDYVVCNKCLTSS